MPQSNRFPPHFCSFTFGKHRHNMNFLNSGNIIIILGCYDYLISVSSNRKWHIPLARQTWLPQIIDVSNSSIRLKKLPNCVQIWCQIYMEYLLTRSARAQLQITFYDFSIESFTAVNVVDKCEFIHSLMHTQTYMVLCILYVYAIYLIIYSRPPSFIARTL